eukprot:6197144-Amphidinium_carterae.1
MEREAILNKTRKAERMANGSTTCKRREFPKEVSTVDKSRSSVQSSERVSEKQGEGVEEDEDEDDNEDLDREYEEAFKTLEQQRLELAGTAEDDRVEDFKWAVLGGAWNLERQGVVSYGIKVSVKANSEMDDFVSHFNLGKSISCTYRVHAEKDSELLAKVWIQRLSFLRSQWVAAGSPSIFAGVSVAGFEVKEPERSAMHTLSSRSQTRLRQIMSLLPS